MNAEIYDDLGFAKVDLSRESRQGYPEVIYGCGKTNEQICGICGSLLSNGGKHILVTRIGKGCACDLEHRFGEVSYSEAASVAIVNPRGDCRHFRHMRGRRSRDYGGSHGCGCYADI